MNNFFEIITDGSCRPGYPEDNTLIISGTDVGNAIDNFHNGGRGHFSGTGLPKSVRKVHYVYVTDAVHTCFVEATLNSEWKEGFPESNTIIVSGLDFQDAILNFYELRSNGKFVRLEKPKQFREIEYVCHIK